MRILTDRHHADLLYALQRLFEDRLGVDVWVPIGREWWDEDIWQFGRCFGDDRLVRQYLEIHDGIHAPVGTSGRYETFDVAHPDRAINLCTLPFARTMQWDYVMATVQENQEGYHRFAHEHSAQYLVNVGNTGQYIDWALDPFVLNNSEAPLLGRGVTVHQELAECYRWSDPVHANRYTVRNFVNALNRLPGWGDFLEAEAQLREFDFFVHGHEGRDGNLNPAGVVAAAMAGSGWGWHDKPVGDGFGHVIHAWAATGRPLIGHGRYYRGKLAEPFWVHGETCIDLDVVPFHDALSLIRDISSDPARHTAMCTNIRSVFDRVVDYEAEAATVREALL